jgi:hypothetical protein
MQLGGMVPHFRFPYLIGHARKSNQFVGCCRFLGLVELSGFINTVSPIHSKRTTMFTPGQSAIECGVRLVGKGFHFVSAQISNVVISSYLGATR